ncbi:right-handed parallel beta-helix repeat-containing protein [Mucisphaera calidilacus]|uniref:Right handed beta helix domain-containing protein n=1 Tax=Mucisphaera calidilacus TaxID=2527982 RepID=A0A518BWY3_9BACT|nr:right-handed parallel beta-helix repeat-containing protein [Mucisphaera calidilacus]QDU71487.1 hypothetical protein Pan265_13370 [Mucisphaera calidilacus]
MTTTQNGLLQDYAVARMADDEMYALIGALDGSEHARGRDAAAVIQEAVDRLAPSGGAVRVGPGWFTLDRPIRLGNGITLAGSGRATVLELSESNAANDGLLIAAEGVDGVTVADLQLRGRPSSDTSAGLHLTTAGTSTVRDVVARGFSGFGVAIERCIMSTVSNVTTMENGKAGLLIKGYDHDRGGKFVPNNVRGCLSYADAGDGIFLDQAICQNVVGCTVYLSGRHGIHLDDGTSNLINGCRVFMSGGNGVMNTHTYEMNISGNIIGWNKGHNLEMNHCVWATVSANEFIDAGGRGSPHHGIYLHNGCKAVQISGNCIFNWWDNQIMRCGIYESEDCRENQFTDNTINYYKEQAVLRRGEDSESAHNLELPHPYGPPTPYGPPFCEPGMEGIPDPRVRNPSPDEIRLILSIEDARAITDRYLNETRSRKDQ